jgi:GMP synthase-like glutamine amidotransferase
MTSTDLPSSTMPTVLVIQHLEPEQPAVLGEVLRDAGCGLQTVRTDADDPVPEDAAGFAGVVVLGGPMSAADDEGFPTRRAELALLRDAVDRGVPTLGVCLGAQLLAVAAGASIRRGADPEIGWGTVDLTAATGEDPLFAGLASPLRVLHWHGETFELPDGAVHLASTERYPNQAFRLGAAAWGLQFHLEVDRPAVERFVAAFPDDAEAASGGGEGIRGEASEALAQLRAPRELVLDRFARLVTSRARTVG